MKRIALFICINIFLMTVAVLATTTFATEIVVPAFSDWTLAGNGKRVDPNILEVTGDGKSSGAWQTKPLKLQPGQFYRYSVSLQGTDTSGGCLPCGFAGFHRDYSAQKDQWVDESFSFRLQDHVSELPLRMGQWESKGTFQFRNIKLETVIPVLKEFNFPFGKIKLGDGETILNGIYRFDGGFYGQNTNIHQPLHYSNTNFNSNRWCFSNGHSVLYRFSLPVLFDAANVQLHVCYYAGGEGVVEASKDGETRWTELGRLDKIGVREFIVPPMAFPLETLYLRIRGLEKSNFQVDSISFEAPLAQNNLLDVQKINIAGETFLATSIDENSETNSEQIDEIVITTDNKIRVGKELFPLEMAATPEAIEQKFRVGNRHYILKTVKTHPLQRSDYGYAISVSEQSGSDNTGSIVTDSKRADLWWCEADWKISRDRISPDKTTAKPIRIFAAKNDVEGFQVVVRANGQPITGLTGTLTELKNKNGTTIPKDNVELLYAYYHFVHSKTDSTGKNDFWPDALPPLDKPINIETGQNQPIWVNVKIPSEIVSGDYTGSFRLQSADGTFQVEIPYTVTVWNFLLPQENHLETAYGFNPWQVARYHNAKTDEDRRRVIEMYLQCFSDHRISIYAPTPFDHIGIKWLPKENPPRCELDFTRFDAEMSRVLDKFHFTNFQIGVHGLGSGTFHDRVLPSIEGFGEDTPEYKAMLSDYLGKLQKHLEEKGWINKAYVYWFDEPAPKDYEFVANGFAKLEKYAPKLRRMITEQPTDGFLETLKKAGTSITIWCPCSPAHHTFKSGIAEKLMENGARFWWYVCTGPKAPHCTLFIDHPATELRVWHWQTWQRNIVGTLVWESTYWHSGAAFPNSFQNPYLDPMSYVSGYSTPPGTKRKWGNGDGRFIYPPLSAAVPNLNNGQPNFEKPVSSIRWEMIREGVEDYEMFYLLRNLLKQNGNKLSAAERQTAEELLIVPESVTKSMSEFTIDPRPLLKRRTEIAEMIEKLNSH
ncbi:MAG: DUF4091 domain-containing protein [Planctomycetaceae bacterium]|jgi:hypothetical protein|nr:DUF4091 domain-containing protein [Planctomycetaceae bacterium]